MTEKHMNWLKNQRPLLADVLASADLSALVSLVAQEHPQTAAIILAHLEPSRGAAVLKAVPDERRADLMQRVAGLEPVDAETLEILAESVQRALLEVEKRGPKSRGGAIHVASLLATMAPEAGTKLLQELTAKDPALGSEVKAGMFRFEDLTRLNDRGMQELLKHVPTATLMLALKGAPPAVATLIFRNVSERAATRLKDDLAAMPKAKRTEVDGAQRQMTDLALKLAEEGQIELPRPGEAYV